jgi:hypothetical protein
VVENQERRASVWWHTWEAPEEPEMSSLRWLSRTMAAVWLPHGCRGIVRPSELQWRVDDCAVTRLVNSLMMHKDGKCRCYADGMLPLPCVRYPTFSFVSKTHCLHTVFVETRERALAGTRRRVVELARRDEQQMSGWPVTRPGGGSAKCQG